MAKGRITNLKPVQSKAEAIARGRVGGIRSGEARRERRTMRQIAAEMLREVGRGAKDSNGALAVAAMFDAAKKGDVQAFKAIAELLGEYNAPIVAAAVVSPIVLGTIPQSKVDAARAAHDARVQTEA